ncbi:MAG: DUF1735 domain-containing protein [Chitinophagales bacterium]|nr:DUF1735 domain-containing protein [Chitinophagales bacterium]
MRILFYASFLLLLSSCLKDKDYNDGKIGHEIAPQKILELAAPNSTASFTAVALDIKSTDTTIELLPVRLSSSAPAEAELVITLDTTVTTSYLTDHPEYSHFKESGGVVLTTTQVIIPKGALASAPLKVKVKTSLFDPAKSYLIGFKVKSVNNSSYGISANYATHYYAFNAKNIYDGVYTLQFKNYHPTSNPGYTGETVEVHMVTTSATKVKIFFPDFGGFYCPAILGGNLTAFSAQEPEYSIDPATQKVTVQNAYSGATTFYTMNPSYDSRYDPATKKIYAKWGYNYVNGTFSSASSREWEQVFTYKSPR